MLGTPKLDSFANRHKKQGDSIDAEAGWRSCANETIKSEGFGLTELKELLLFSCKFTEFI